MPRLQIAAQKSRLQMQTAFLGLKKNAPFVGMAISV
jgi:hypothetical protein